MGDPASFFEQKQAAAVFKHRVLSQYLRPWAAKVGARSAGGRVVILDGYAGAGKYSDGEVGSPLLMARFARSLPTRSVDLVFVEKDRDAHAALVANLKSEGHELAMTPLRGAIEDHLPGIISYVGDTPMFVFLDPFGFAPTFDQILTSFYAGTRSHAKTDILINFTADGARRHVGLLRSPKPAKSREAALARFDGVCGGQWWRAIAYNAPDAETASGQIAEIYLQNLVQAIGGHGITIPVRRAPHQKPIYHLVFAGKHFDGLALMIDAFSKAGAEWRAAVYPPDNLFRLEGTESVDEEVRAGGWVVDIKNNVRSLLRTAPSLHVGAKVGEIYGATIGEAREMHVRRALKDLANEGWIAPVGTGTVYAWTISRT